MGNVMNMILGGKGGSGEYASIFVKGLTQSDTVTCTSPSGKSISGAWTTKTVEGVSVSGWLFANLDEYGTYTITSGGKSESVLVDVATDYTLEWAVVPRDGLIAEYTFDDVIGTTILDTSDYGNDATARSGVTFPVGKVGNCSKGVADSTGYITTGLTTSNFNIIERSLSFWLKPPSSLSQEARVFEADGAGWSNGLFTIWYNDTSGASLRLWQGAGYIDFSIPVDSWTHIVVTISATRIVKLYINGVFTGSANGDGDKSSSGGNELVLNVNRNKNADYAANEIDQFRAYNRELTAAEVATLYNGGNGI